MSRPFISTKGKRRVGTTVSLIDEQPVELRKRGGSAYLRLVLSTPVPPQHKLEKKK